MRTIVLVAFICACADRSIHDITQCDQSWGTTAIGKSCEIACEYKPYNQDMQPDTGSGNPPETCLAGTLGTNGSPTSSCARVAYSNVDGTEHRGCCKTEVAPIRFVECCTESIGSGGIPVYSCP